MSLIDTALIGLDVVAASDDPEWQRLFDIAAPAVREEMLAGKIQIGLRREPVAEPSRANDNVAHARCQPAS